MYVCLVRLSCVYSIVSLLTLKSVQYLYARLATRPFLHVKQLEQNSRGQWQSPSIHLIGHTQIFSVARTRPASATCRRHEHLHLLEWGVGRINDTYSQFTDADAQAHNASATAPTPTISSKRGGPLFITVQPLVALPLFLEAAVPVNDFT